MLVKLNRMNGQPELTPVKLDELHYDPDRRRVIVLPGAAIHPYSAPSSIAGCIKYAEQSLERAMAHSDSPPIDIYVWVYDEAFESFGGHGKHYRGDRQPAYYGAKIGTNAIRHLLLKPGEHMEQLTPDDMKVRLSHLTLLGHSFGSIVSQDITYYLVREMKRMVQTHCPGWNEAAVSDVIKELVTVSVASAARQDLSQPNATQYFFTASNDRLAKQLVKSHTQNKEIQDEMLKACGYEKEPVSRGRTRQQFWPSSNRYHVSTAMPEDDVAWRERRWDGRMQERRMHGDHGQLKDKDPEHAFSSFLFCNPVTGTLLRNVMNNAVLREPGIGTGEILLQKMPQHFSTVSMQKPTTPVGTERQR